MRLRVLGLAAALMMTTSLAQAAWDVDAVTQSYLDQGYTRIEVKIGPTQAKIEAIKDGTKLEVIYDLATGDVVKTETDAVEADDNTTPGVFIRKDDEDFGGGGSNDDSDDDMNDDHGGDDDGSDDDSGDDDSGDDDHHGGDDDHEDDGDHHGGDDHEDDDHEDDDDRSGSNSGRG